MIGITLLVTLGSLPRVDFAALPHAIGPIHSAPSHLWLNFVGIVLALSGVEAIGNLTGVMKKPVARPAVRAHLGQVTSRPTAPTRSRGCGTVGARVYRLASWLPPMCAEVRDDPGSRRVPSAT